MNEFNTVNSIFNGGVISLTRQLNNVSIFNNNFINFYCLNGLGMAMNLVNGAGSFLIINNIITDVDGGIAGNLFLL
jgi:hypothetical protein